MNEKEIALLNNLLVKYNEVKIRRVQTEIAPAFIVTVKDNRKKRDIDITDYSCW